MGVRAERSGLMPDQAWKQFERWVCKVFGGIRDWQNPEECAGTDPFAPEAKYRKKIPNWLEEMMVQAENQANDSQFPLVVLTEHQRPRYQSLVIIRLVDFIDWFVGWHTEPSSADEE
jgi:hypothetical protein